MRKAEQSSLILAAGLWVSLGMHAALGFGLSQYRPGGDDAGASGQDPRSAPTLPELAQPPEPERKPPQERELQLGIADGSESTMTWLGFKEATEHSGKEATVEQSAMTLEPADPGQTPDRAPGPPGPPQPPTQMAAGIEVPDEAPLTPEAEPAQETVFVDPPTPSIPPTPPTPATLPRESLEQLAGQLARLTREAAEATEQLAQSVQGLFEAPAEVAPPAPAPPPAPPAIAQAPSAEPKPAPAQAGGGGGMPGIQADRESVATAVMNAPGVKPGKVLAAEGLEILTRQPRFTVTTRLTLRPRNPTVAVTFGRDGRVTRAVFVSDGSTVYNTGADEIDQPLLNAIYSWSARGEALDELDPTDPRAGVRVMFTILLGG